MQNKMTQEASRSLRGRMFQADDARPKENRILVLKTGMAGYYKLKPEYIEMGATDPGKELLLFRESDNFGDEWAIRVYLTPEIKLGYVPRFKNEAIARLMDMGKKFIAVVDPVEEYANMSEKDRERSLHVLTEDMKYPFSIYMIEEME